MKNINKLFILFAAASLVAVSCAKTQEYVPAEKETGSQVYFPADLPSSYNLKEYAEEYIEIPVYRYDASSAATITLKSSVASDDPDAASKFAIPAAVNFAAGQKSQNVQISWTLASIVEAKDYKISLELAGETTLYGDSAYKFTASKPASWIKWGTGHIYEDCWGEDYATTMYYQETDYENIRFCKLANAWNDISGAAPVPTADYFFYWNTKTNDLYVPYQTIGMSSSSGYEIYTSTAAEFYNAYYGWGMVIPSQEYFDWAIAWNKKNDFANGYYDGNGGFYLADWMYLVGADGKPTGSGYQFGGNQDYFIANGFNRKTDYNDEKHIGASLPLFTGDIESMFFSPDAENPYKFKGGLRYDDINLLTDPTCVYYIPDYFGDGHCLAFTSDNILVVAATGTGTISDVDNEQATGLSIFGYPIYVNVKKGEWVVDTTAADMSFSLQLKVYTMDENGAVVHDFGTVTEKFTVTGELKDNYTWSDVYGGYYEDYLGTWNVVSTSFSSTPTEYSYSIKIEEAGENKYKISNLSGFSKYFNDVIYADYDAKYYVMAIHPQDLDATYGGEAVSMLLLDPDAGKIYSAAAAEIDGGICNDGALAFVNIYNNMNLCGFYYKTASSALCGLYYTHSIVSGDTSVTNYYEGMKRDYVSLPSEAKPMSASKNTSLRFTKVSGVDSKRFSLSPVVKSARTIVELDNTNVAF